MMKRHVPAAGRRDFLKASALLGLSTTAPLLMTSCGGGDDTAATTAPASPRETQHLHFDLSAAPIEAPTLHALRSLHHRAPLVAHDAESRAKHRELNAALVSVPDERLTHYLEDVDLPAGALQGMQVYGRVPGTDRVVLAGSFIHVPSAAQATVRARAAGRAAAARGAGHATRLALPDESGNPDATIDPFDAAVYLVFHHPEVMNLNPSLGAEILDRIANLPCDPNDASCTPLIGSLAEAIAQSISANGWPSTTAGGWMTLIPMTQSDGSPVFDDQGNTAYRYDIDDTIAAKTGDVVKAILKNIFDDTLFEGSNWHAPTTAASAAVPNASPTGLRRTAVAAAAAGDGFTVAAQLPVGSSASGMRMVGLSADEATRTVKLTIKNDYLRFLSIYLQHLDANQEPLPITDPGSLDSTRARYLTVVGCNDQLMGIPFQGSNVSSTDIVFAMPDGAAHTNVLFGSLGLGGDSFTHEAVAGASLTLAFNIGIPTMLLAAGVYSDLKAGWEAIFKDEALLKLVLGELVTGLRNAGSGLANGIYSTATSQSAQSFIVSLANVALQALLGAAPTIGAEITAQITATAIINTAMGPIGIALKVLSVLADLAGIAVTIGECLACPAITTNRVSLTMDTTVRIAKDDRDFQFPASATNYRVDAYYDGGSTPRNVTGTVEPGRVDPIEAVLAGVPSGGNVVFHVFMYSPDGCLVGSCVSDKLVNLPASAGTVDLKITELVAALRSNTQYQHHLKLGYQNGARAWTPAAQSQATLGNLCQGRDGAICALNGLTVHTASGMAGYGFLAGGQGAGICGAGTGTGTGAILNTIQNQFLGQDPDRAAKFSGCGTPQPIGIVYDALGAAVGGHHFFLQPDASGALHLRGITLDATTGFDMAQTTSWGRFTNVLDSMAVLPSGYVVGVNRTTHKMEVLLLPASAADPTLAPKAIPFATMKAGQGSRPGLFDTPVAVATAQGAILVLEQGNARVQAVDPSAGPVALFNNKTTNLMPLVAETGVVYLDLAVESQGYAYVLSYIGGGLTPLNYRLDVYSPNGDFLSRTTGVAAARLAVDLFRNVYTLNYEPLAGSPRVEPTLSQWLPVTPNACPSALPAAPAAARSPDPALACGTRSWLERFLRA